MFANERADETVTGDGRLSTDDDAVTAVVDTVAVPETPTPFSQARRDQ